MQLPIFGLNNKKKKQNKYFINQNKKRIPEFREKLLSAIVKADDIPITEWRGSEYKLEEKDNNL